MMINQNTMDAHSYLRHFEVANQNLTIVCQQYKDDTFCRKHRIRSKNKITNTK